MSTFNAATVLPGKSQSDSLGEALEMMDPAPAGVGVFEIEDGSDVWEVCGYFLDSPDDIDLALLSAAFDAKAFVVTEIPNQDWIAKVCRDLPPVEAGRFFVYGSHDTDKVPKARISLLIEAAMAFGTGHHGTTLGCLKSFDRLLSKGKIFENVLDLGCGTAVLAIAAAFVAPQTVIASDIDPVAVEVAEANVVANNLEGRVLCVESIGFNNPILLKKAPFDLIFANILKGPLMDLASDLSLHLCSGGIAVLSGILVEQADEILVAYSAQNMRLTNREDLGEWTALTLIKE